MGTRKEFLDEFDKIWPGWRDDMEKNTDYAEKTGQQVSCTGHYSITISDGKVEATIYRGDNALDRFSWPLRDPDEIHRNKLMAEYELKGGFDD